MDLTIPEKLANIGPRIEHRYRIDRTFRDIYDDYLAYLKAYRYWVQSRSTEAPSRRTEYAELVRELEDEVMQLLNAESSTQTVD